MSRLRMAGGIAAASIALAATSGCYEATNPTVESDRAAALPRAASLVGTSVPLSYWPADGHAGDVVGNNHGTLAGGAGFGPGVAGQAFHLDGVDDYVDVSGLADDINRLGNTIELWVKPAVALNASAPPQFFYAQWHRHFIAYANGSLVARATVCAFSGCGAPPGDYILTHPVELPAGEWHQIALSFSAGDRTALYLNGELVADRAETLNLGLAWFPAIPAFSLGRIFHDIGAQGHVAGSLDEVKVFNSALSASEVRASFDARTGAPIVIDIKPGSAENVVNVGAGGVVTVAALSTSAAAGESADFDATTLDWSTVRFGNADAAEHHGRGHVEDVDGDGDLDMVFHFSVGAIGLGCVDAAATLTGRTTTGTRVRGTDMVRPRGC